MKAMLVSLVAALGVSGIAVAPMWSLPEPIGARVYVVGWKDSETDGVDLIG